MAGVDQVLQQSCEKKRKWMESYDKRKEKSYTDKKYQYLTFDSSNIKILSSQSS